MQLRDVQMLDSRSVDGKMTSLDYDALPVVELYLQVLARRVATVDTAKVILELVTQDAQRHNPQLGPPDVARVVRWPFDFGAFEDAGEDWRPRMLHDALHAGLLWTADALGWDRRPFIDASAAVASANYTYSGYLLRKPVPAPDRSRSVNLSFRFQGRHILVDAIVLAKDGSELSRVHAFTTFAHYDRLRLLAKRVRWLSSRRIRIESSSTVAGPKSYTIALP